MAYRKKKRHEDQCISQESAFRVYGYAANLTKHCFTILCINSGTKTCHSDDTDRFIDIFAACYLHSQAVLCSLHIVLFAHCVILLELTGFIACLLTTGASVVHILPVHFFSYGNTKYC